MNSMISQVYHEQKNYNKKGDFVNIVTKDLVDVENIMMYDEIKQMSKGTLKGFVR